MGFEILAIVGPTASGKSDLAVSIALELQSEGKAAEIVNADAMQLYRGMDIGTAKLASEDKRGIPHHLLDVIGSNQEMTAVEYQKLARETFDQLLRSGSMPILAGGSMFYVAAALDDLDFSPTNPEVRSRLETEAETFGPGILFERLRQQDPITAQRIPAQNVRRVIRALEVIEITGRPYPSQLPEPTSVRPALILGIDVDREVLKARIAKRVEGMWRNGLLDEARVLIEAQELSRTASKAIGYAQALAQLRGEMTEREAIEETVALTNRYARRQMSWFRRDKRILWLDGEKELIPQALEQIRLYS